MLFLIGGSFNFIGKLFISTGTGIVGYLLITKVEQFNSKLNSPILPTTVNKYFFYIFLINKVMLLLGWLIGSLVMNIYGMSGDAMLHCFVLDEEKNDKVAKCSPKKLQDFMQNERGE